MSLLRGPIVWVTELPFVRKVVTESSLGWRVAGRFVAGPTLEHGMAAAKALHEKGILAMLDHLGENVDSPAKASAAADAYIRALKRVRESPELDSNISVKLTQLGLDVSKGLCLENMERVLQVASEPDPATLVMIDMEARRYVDPTLLVYLSLRERYPNVGVCLQSYLRRTPGDARLIAGPSAIVRMAKGAYLEPPEHVYRTRDEVRRVYARVSATLLLAGSTVHLATHDPRLVEGAKRFVRTRSISERQYEFQMLYGIRRDLQASLVPYGSEWYPYLTRRLAERPANVWFFVSNALRR